MTWLSFWTELIIQSVKQTDQTVDRFVTGESCCYRNFNARVIIVKISQLYVIVIDSSDVEQGLIAVWNVLK